MAAVGAAEVPILQELQPKHGKICLRIVNLNISEEGSKKLKCLKTALRKL